MGRGRGRQALVKLAGKVGVDPAGDNLGLLCHKGPPLILRPERGLGESLECFVKIHNSIRDSAFNWDF